MHSEKFLNFAHRIYVRGQILVIHASRNSLAKEGKTNFLF